MAAKKISISISKTIGTISAKIVEADKAKAVIVMAHGAGAGMDHPFMLSLAEELEKKSVTTMRYNFPFMENKKKRPDPPAIAEKTVEAVVQKANELYPKLPLFVAGKSFGGRMSSQRLSKEPMTEVKGIIFFGFPLHPSGAPSTERANHLSTVTVPMLFLSGTKDTLAELPLLKKVTKTLSRATVITFEGADHSFKRGKENLLPKLAGITSEWIDQIIS